jgi:hypothetical protein
MPGVHLIMSSDIVMIALVLAGIALTITYFYVATLFWRQHTRRERKNAAVLRDLHAKHIRPASPADDRKIAA